MVPTPSTFSSSRGLVRNPARMPTTVLSRARARTPPPSCSWRWGLVAGPAGVGTTTRESAHLAQSRRQDEASSQVGRARDHRLPGGCALRQRESSGGRSSRSMDGPMEGRARRERHRPTAPGWAACARPVGQRRLRRLVVEPVHRRASRLERVPRPGLTMRATERVGAPSYSSDDRLRAEVVDRFEGPFSEVNAASGEAVEGTMYGTRIGPPREGLVC